LHKYASGLLKDVSWPPDIRSSPIRANSRAKLCSL
jgi:hypothetical protein